MILSVLQVFGAIKIEFEILLELHSVPENVF